MKKVKLVLIAGCALVVGVASFAAAAEIVGTVTDASGQALNGSKISVADQSGRVAGNAITDQQGRYVIEGLKPGQYDITLDTANANLKGDTAVSYVKDEGLTVDWAVAPAREAIATARPGTEQPTSSNPNMIASSDDKDSPPGCKGMEGPPCGPKSPKK